jgi:integrase
MPKRNTGPQIKWRKDRACWEIVEFVGGRRKRLATGIDSREDAERRLAETLAVRTRKTGRCEPTERLIGDLLADYIVEHAPHTAGPQTLAYNVENLSPFWAVHTVAFVKPSTCQEYLRLRQERHIKKQKEAFAGRLARWEKSKNIPRPQLKLKPLSDSTVRRELQILKAAMWHDYEHQRLTSVPPVWLPEKGGRRERWLTRSEIAAIIREARAEIKTREYLPWFILIAYYTGVRKSAVLGLRWPQVDLERGIINWNEPGKKQTKKRRPIQPMNKKLWRLMIYMRRRGTDMGYVLHIDQQRIGDVRKGFSGAAARAGIENVSPHTLCHTTITHLLQNGVPTWEVAGFVGRTEDTVRREYGHHSVEYLSQARDSFTAGKRRGGNAAPVTGPKNAKAGK